MRAAPGVVSAAQSTIVPISGWSAYRTIRLDNGRNVQSLISPVSSGYFSTLGTPLLSGRDFGSEDGEKSQFTAIVNDAFARRYLSGGNPVGRSFRHPSDEQQFCRIVGLVRNTKYERLQEEFAPIVFFPASQMFFGSTYARFVVRSALPPAELTRAVRQAVLAVSPSIDIDFIRLDTQMKESVTRERMLAALFGGGFGLLAALLAAVGLFGVLSYSVERRRREIGIRMALGADSRAVVRLVTREAGVLVAVGAAVGVAITFAASRAAATLLYGLQPGDPPALVGAVLTLALIGLASAYLPARRAATLDPLSSLRQEYGGTRVLYDEAGCCRAAPPRDRHPHGARGGQPGGRAPGNPGGRSARRSRGGGRPAYGLQPDDPPALVGAVLSAGTDRPRLGLRAGPPAVGVAITFAASRAAATLLYVLRARRSAGARRRRAHAGTDRPRLGVRAGPPAATLDPLSSLRQE